MIAVGFEQILAKLQAIPGNLLTDGPMILVLAANEAIQSLIRPQTALVDDSPMAMSLQNSLFLGLSDSTRFNLWSATMTDNEVQPGPDDMKNVGASLGALAQLPRKLPAIAFAAIPFGGIEFVHSQFMRMLPDLSENDLQSVMSRALMSTTLDAFKLSYWDAVTESMRADTVPLGNQVDPVTRELVEPIKPTGFSIDISSVFGIVKGGKGSLSTPSSISGVPASNIMATPSLYPEAHATPNQRLVYGGGYRS